MRGRGKSGEFLAFGIKVSILAGSRLLHAVSRDANHLVTGLSVPTVGTKTVLVSSGKVSDLRLESVIELLPEAVPWAVQSPTHISSAVSLVLPPTFSLSHTHSCWLP